MSKVQLTTVQQARLSHACRVVKKAFRSTPYLVGSVTERSDFRDVDVRVVLADDEFDALFGERLALWGLVCLTISQYLADVTGLPVDFQVQRRTEANELHPGPRHALGLDGFEFAGGGDATRFAEASEQGATA